jgi:hypothetical protein
MKLSRAATYFDDLTCRDAYGRATFKAQMVLYSTSVRDGLGAVRRTLSTASTVKLPPRKTISTGDKVWLVGERHPDYFNNQVIRNRYTLQQADALGTLLSFSEALEDLPGYEVYASLTWTRYDQQIETSSEMFNTFEVFFASAEPLPLLGLLRAEGLWYILQDPYLTEGGLLAAHGVFLPDPLATIQVRQRVYQPIEDAWVEEDLPLPALHLRWQDHFRYFARYSETYAPGDRQFILRKADLPDPTTSHRLILAGQPYALVTQNDEGDVWSIHGRPA